MMEHQNNFNRRDMLKAAGAAAIGVMGTTAPLAFGGALPATAKKVLVFLKVCDLPAGTPDPVASITHAIKSLGASDRYNITVTTDGSVLTASHLATYDYVVFYTTGSPSRQAGLDGKPITAAGEQALTQAIAGGKALVAIHCGLRSSAGVAATQSSTPTLDPVAKILADFKDVAGALPLLWAGKASGLHIADHKVRALGGSVGKTPLPLRIVSVQWQDGTDIKTRRPVLTLLFASTSPLLKNVLKYAK